MTNRFGQKLLKIEPIDEFIKRIKSRTRAFRTRIHDVVYTDTKAYTQDDDELCRRTRDMLMKEAPDFHLLNRESFAQFYELSLFPSLLAKPSSYASERERRIIFESRDDLHSPTIRIDDKSLLDFVSVVKD
jgi:hypothetical protein